MNRSVADVLDATTAIYRYSEVVQTGHKTPVNLVKAFADAQLDADQTRLALNTVNLSARALTAEKVWVSKEMIELCLAAEGSLPEVPLKESDLPWERAVVLFEKPLGHTTAPDTGVERPIDVIQWETGVALYTDAPNRPNAVFVTCYAMGSPFATPTGTTLWPFGDLPTGEWDDPVSAQRHRVLFVMWSMVRDRIACTERRRSPRPGARRFERDHKMTPKDLVVITLRHPNADHHDSEAARSVEWTHRWIVDGHWRHQWYPSLNDHRPKWIAPYVKGPDTAPLVVKDKVYAWTR